MANYTTLLVLLSMAATARCSWISGGAPPPSSVSDLMPGEQAGAPSPIDDFIIQEKDLFADGPSSDYIPEEKSLVADGPSGDFMTQGKTSVADGPAGSIDDLILQGKESLLARGQKFVVQGKVYCDPCRIQFPTKISYPLPNTKIILACHKQDSTEETYRLEGVSDDKGRYILNAIGDHAEEVCEVSVTESPDPKCPELMDDENNVKVSLTNKNGVTGNGRFANPLGFMVNDADPRCKEVLDELGFTGI